MKSVEEKKKADIDNAIREIKVVEKIKNKLIENGHKSIAKQIEYQHDVTGISLYDSLEIWWAFFPQIPFDLDKYYKDVWELG